MPAQNGDRTETLQGLRLLNRSGGDDRDSSGCWSFPGLGGSPLYVVRIREDAQQSFRTGGDEVNFVGEERSLKVLLRRG